MTTKGICMLANALKLAILAAVWTIGALMNQWKMDFFTFLLFAWVYYCISSECGGCSCGDEDDD